MVTVLLLALVALLGYIAYRLSVIEQTGLDLKSYRSTLSTSLNPLFSEEEIAIATELHEKWQKRADRSFEALQQIEKQEIETYQRSGRSKADFVPSGRLKEIIQDLTLALRGRDATQTKWQKMIEAHIAVLRGAKLSDISNAFYSDDELGKWSNFNTSCTDEKFIAAVHGEPVRRDYDEGLSERMKLWQNNWDTYLKNA